MKPADRPHWRFWPKRMPRAIPVPATSLWENLEISARRYPDKPALDYLGHESATPRCATRPRRWPAGCSSAPACSAATACC